MTCVVRVTVCCVCPQLHTCRLRDSVQLFLQYNYIVQHFEIWLTDNRCALFLTS